MDVAALGPRGTGMDAQQAPGQERGGPDEPDDRDEAELRSQQRRTEQAGSDPSHRRRYDEQVSAAAHGQHADDAGGREVAPDPAHP